MSFITVAFIIFLAITFVTYYLFGSLAHKFKKIPPQWVILLVASLVFYGFTNWVYLIYLVGSAIFVYAFSLLIQHKIFHITKADLDGDLTKYTVVFDTKNIKYVEDHKSRKAYENLLMAFVITALVAVLAVLKYYNFFGGVINSLIGSQNIPPFNFIVPIGISFYTLSLIAYVVDCTLRRTTAEKNILKFVLFVSYFPKALMGPISSYDKLKEEGLFQNHKFSDQEFLPSLTRIAIGVVKKVIIADVIALYVNATYNNINNESGVGLVLGSLLYSIQLYCDFSGYLDMAIGVSGLFGIKLEENFKTPYLSPSIKFFCQRWHITLGAWLKKYIYIPMGGNRVNVFRWCLNILVVWFISGLWHGASWTYIVWGIYMGILVVLFGLPKQIKKRQAIKHPEESIETQEKPPLSKEKSIAITSLKIILTFSLVNLGWVFFRASSINEAFAYIGGMFQIWKSGTYSVFSDSALSAANPYLIVSFVFIALLIAFKALDYYKPQLVAKFSHYEVVAKYGQFVVIVAFLSLAIFANLSVYALGGGESSFIYLGF